MQTDLADVVEEFIGYIEQIPFDSDDEWDSDLDEGSYRAEQTAFCGRFPRSTGPLVYNALLFYVHGASAELFSADWVKQHTDGRFVLLSLGKGYYAVLIATLAATLKALDRITCQAHPFYRETNRQSRIPNDPQFADKVRDWQPVWCANELFVRFATTDDRVMEYLVLYSDYDVTAPSASPTSEAGSWPTAPVTPSAPAPVAPDAAAASPAGSFAAAATPAPSLFTNGHPVPGEPEVPGQGGQEADQGDEPAGMEEGPAKKKPKRTPQEKEALRRVKEANRGLPPGWRAFLDPHGNLYYGNASTGAASWVRPTQ